MARLASGLVLFLDGVPDSAGELFARYAISNVGSEVPLRDDENRVIGTAVTRRGADGNLYVDATILEDDFPAGPTFASIGAQVFDCDHRLPNIPGLDYDGPHLIRVNDADVTHVTLGARNPDHRVLPLDVTVFKAPHDGAGTEPEE